MRNVTVYVAVGVTYQVDEVTGAYERVGGMFVEADCDPIEEYSKVWNHDTDDWQHASMLDDLVNDGLDVDLRSALPMDSDAAVAGYLPTDVEAVKRTVTDREALDTLNLLLSAEEWPGASGMEDVCEIVRATGRVEVADAPEWERH